MSVFSDYRVGALSEVEFHNACVEMNARDRWEREHEYDYLYDEEEDYDGKGEEDQATDHR